MKTVKEMAEIMLAYASGNEIEISTKGCENWVVDLEPGWNWFYCDYRVKKIEPEVGKKYKFINSFEPQTRTCIAVGQRQVVFGLSNVDNTPDFLVYNFSTFKEFVNKGQVKCVK